MPSDEEAAAVVVQAAVRGYLDRIRIAKDPLHQRYKKRCSILKELLAMEETYVKQLRILIERFQKPLLRNSYSTNAIVTKEKVVTVFGKVDALLKFHNGFLRGLRVRIRGNALGSFFVDQFDKEAQYKYQQYISNYDQADRVLGRLNRSAPFVEFMEECFSKVKADSTSFLHLPSYLIRPVQQIPKYIMLLNHLVKYTEKEHPSYHELSKAASHMSVFSQHIDETFSDDSQSYGSSSFCGEKALPTYMMPTYSSTRKQRSPYEPEKSFPPWKVPGKSATIFRSEANALPLHLRRSTTPSPSPPASPRMPLTGSAKGSPSPSGVVSKGAMMRRKLISPH